MSIFDSTTDSAASADNGTESAPPASADSQGDLSQGLPAGDTTPGFDAGTDSSLPDFQGDGSQEQTPEPRYLDIDEFGDHLVKVKVDGVEQELPLSEVRNGLMMQRAFTQRTQQLAAERQRLANAEALVRELEQNPEAVLRQLSEAYDVDPLENFAPIERSPEEVQLRQLQAQQAAMQEQYQAQRVQAQIAQIQATDPKADISAVAQVAVQAGVELPVAFELYQARELQRQQAEQAEQQRRRQAAQAASQATHQGAGRGTAPGVGATGKPAGSLREAYLMAVAEHGNPNS